MTSLLTRIVAIFANQDITTLHNSERMLVLRDGEFTSILKTGTHILQRKGLEVARFHLSEPRFRSVHDLALFRQNPEMASDHLHEWVAGPDEICVISRKDQPFDVLTPEQRVVLWKDAGPFSIERYDLTSGMQVRDDLARRLVRTNLGDNLTQLTVSDGFVGHLFIDDVPVGILQPGKHYFWAAGQSMTLRQVDLRLREHEVSGQELLTKDRVTLRITLVATYKVVDAEKALTQVKSFEDSLHRVLQLALRRRVGTLTLDDVLAERGTIAASDEARDEMHNIGIELREVALKDVILPGEMRDILNQVVAAEKEAQANVIRRREETNATRSLLNTAKVMAENPVMLRLKELEALESIADKVEQLNVHNGTQGLLGDIARLRD